MNIPEVGQFAAANFDALLFPQGQTPSLRFFERTTPFKPQD
jgi:hypothetical protein